MNSKYLKYKNKYTLLKESIFNNSLNTDNKNSIILYGSGFFSLQGEERDIYIARCEKMYCNSLPEAECYSIIKKNIQDLYKIAKDLIKSYDMSDTRDLYLRMKQKFENIERIDISTPTISTLNIISLQCVILFTEIVKVIEPHKSTMENYNGGGSQAIELQKLYIELTKEDKWDDYDYIYKLITKSVIDPVTQRQIVLITKPLKRLVYTNNYINIINCKNIKKQRLCVILGELTLFEILNSLANDIFLIGITPHMGWADGYYYTPFEFMDHDMVHAINRETSGYGQDTLVYSKPFIEYLITNKDIPKDSIDKIVIILFLIMHEDFFNGDLLNTPVLKSNVLQRIIWDKLLNIKRWTDINNFGGLLPEYIFNNPSRIIPYLEDAYILFVSTWNSFFTPSHI